MKKTIFAVILLILMFSLQPFVHVAKGNPQSGPRTENFVIRSYGSMGYAYAALVKTNPEIDLLADELTYTQYLDAISRSDIVVDSTEMRDMFEFDINNERYNPGYPNWVSPTHYRGFRQALAFLTPKNYIVDEICSGFAERIDQPIPASLGTWRNESYWYPDYPYDYNTVVAATRLDEAGFTQGSTENQHYNPDFPGSAEHIRTYPPGHSKEGQDLDALVLLIRYDDQRMLEAGRLLCQNMLYHGIPVQALERGEEYCIERVFRDHNYHIYTGKWEDLDRSPPPYLYSLYHSDFSFSYGRNYVTGDETYPILDSLLYTSVYTPSGGESHAKCKIALGYFTEECITIPLWSTVNYFAWRKDLLGIVNEEGVGPINGWTFMNAYKPDGSAIFVGHEKIPDRMNIIYSDLPTDYLYLNRMNLYDGIEVPPYDSSVDQSGFVKNWVVDSYIDPADGEEKTKNTRSYRSDSWFVKPVTGDQLENVNATHVYACIWYYYQLVSSWHCASVEGINYLNLSSDHRTLDLYWDSLSYWNTYLAAIPILSFNLLRSGDISKYCETTVGYAQQWLNLPEDVYWVEEVTYDDDGTIVTLQQGVDWEIYSRTGHSSRADVKLLNPDTYEHTVYVKYWAVDDPIGSWIYPGNLLWQDGLEGCGMYYAIDFVYDYINDYSSLTLERNPFYYMETPPLGEIDFIRKGNGCYKIDIFDVVIVSSAYPSQGTAVPDSNWFPGADLAPQGGLIDIFDVITVTGKYGLEWDPPS